MSENRDTALPLRYCTSCQAQVRLGDAFCASCGTRLGTGGEAHAELIEKQAVAHTTARADNRTWDANRTETRIGLNLNSTFWKLVILAAVVYFLIFLFATILNAAVPESNDGGPGTILGGMFAVVFTIIIVIGLVASLVTEGSRIFTSTAVYPDRPPAPKRFRTPDGRVTPLSWSEKGQFWYYVEYPNRLDPSEFTGARFLDHTPIPVDHPAFPKNPLVYGRPVVRDGRIIYYRRIDSGHSVSTGKRTEWPHYRDAKGGVIDKEHPAYELARKDLEEWYAENRPNANVPSRYDSKLP